MWVRWLMRGEFGTTATPASVLGQPKNKPHHDLVVWWFGGAVVLFLGFVVRRVGDFLGLGCLLTSTAAEASRP